MTDPSRRRSLLIADDHEHVGASLKALLAPDYDVVALVPNGDAVVDTVRRLRPDAVLLDLWLPGRNGLDVLTDLRRELPEIRVVILTMHADVVVAVEAMTRGAQGYLLKDSGYAELHGALKEVFDGKVYLSPRVTGEAATTIYRDRAVR
jgi:DNA-binding NarL/FixJ family response regulator